MAKKPKTETPLHFGSGTSFYGTVTMGGLGWTATVPTPKTPEETAIIRAVRQLETWRERGYELHVRSTDAGWKADLNEDDDDPITLRFSSNYHPTFVAAVQKAMEVIK